MLGRGPERQPDDAAPQRSHDEQTAEPGRLLLIRSDGVPPLYVGWAAGDTGWFADQVTLVFPAKTIPLRMTGVAVRQDGTWRLVQLHVSAAVSDEALLSA